MTTGSRLKGKDRSWAMPLVGAIFTYIFAPRDVIQHVFLLQADTTSPQPGHSSFHPIFPPHPLHPSLKMSALSGHFTGSTPARSHSGQFRGSCPPTKLTPDTLSPSACKPFGLPPSISTYQFIRTLNVFIFVHYLLSHESDCKES
jgi:hypothetical protein